MLTRGSVRFLSACILVLTGCGDFTPQDESVDAVASAIVPAGSNAAVVSNTIPLQMYPGERLNVQAVMQNTGAASPANDWPVSSDYALYRTNSLWSWTYDRLETTTNVGANTTFNYVIVAPTTAGTYSFGARMRTLSAPEYFGQELLVAGINVNAANTPRWRCTWDQAGSDFPTTIAANQTRTISLRLTNSGTGTWAATNFALRSQDTPTAFWKGGSTVNLTSAVAPGASTTLSFAITAPATNGVYSFKREMSDLTANGVGFFGLGCVDTNITVGGVPPLDAAPVSNTFPATIAPGDRATVSVTVTNTGTTAWTNDGNYVLYSRSNPVSLWGITSVPVTTATAQGQQATFTFQITAPTTPGTYSHSWRMRSLLPTGGYFGTQIDVPVTVDGSLTPSYGATVVSQTVPARMLAGAAGEFRVTFQNSGSGSWVGANFGANSRNNPVGLWGPTNKYLTASETIAAGQQKEFVFAIHAPTTPGNYESRWRMRNFNTGGALFGDEAVSPVVVTVCGNGTLDTGEACDDGNWDNGDGCSDQCTREGRVLDLAAGAADRTITGSGTNKQLAPVTIGDVTNDGVADIVVAENRNVLPTSGRVRNTAGTVTGFTGGASFFNSTSNVVTTGFAFEILGASANDSLGAYGTGGIKIGDVTGDGVADLIASAPGGDGLMEARLDAGEVYVLTGGAGLTGTIDLAAAPTVLAATIIGEAAGDMLMLRAVGDVTGDGVADLVLSSNTTTGGSVYVVAGGATLTGTIDLTAPGTATVYKMTGLIAGSVAGTAAVGDLGGSATADLLIGAANEAPGGRTNAGAAYAILGPINANVNLSLAAGAAGGPSVVWLGAGANDKLGCALAVGDVSGDGAGDAVIGASQARKAGLQVGTVDVWHGGLTAGTTFDLSASAVPNTRILGRDEKDTNASAIALGDFTGDGVADIATTAPSGDGPANDRDGAGELLVVRGGTSLGATVDLSTYPAFLEIYGAVSRDLLGGRPEALSVGFIDTDARADICVGSQKGGTNGTLTSPGRVDCFRAGN